MVKKSKFSLEQLFGSKTRAKLLGIFLQHPEQAFFVRELTRKIKAQLNSVRRELQNLVELGLVYEVKKTKQKKGGKVALSDKKKYYQVNTDYYLFEELRLLMKKAQILLKKNLVKIINEKGTIDFLVLTGKFVDRTDIPTDILIVGDIDQKVLQKSITAFEREMGEEINYTLMPRDEFVYRKDVTDRFLYSILEGDKVIMVDKFGFIKPTLANQV